MSPPFPTRLGVDTVSIRRLRLRLRGPAGVSGREAQVRAALAGASWPQPEADAWVMLRAVTVRSAGLGGVGLAAARSVAARMAAAVDLGSPGAAQADAVRARDLVELIVHLALDLAGGQAAGRWYWRRWSALLALPTAEALAQLLGAHPAALATITARLATLGRLGLVWRGLSPAGAATVLDRLATLRGLRLLRPDVGRQPTPAALPAPLVARWQRPLAGLAPDNPRVMLAVVLVALEWRPLWLTAADADAAGRLAALTAALLAVPGDVATLPADGGAASPGRTDQRGDGATSHSGQGRAVAPAWSLVAAPGLPAAGPAPVPAPDSDIAARWQSFAVPEPAPPPAAGAASPTDSTGASNPAAGLRAPLRPAPDDPSPGSALDHERPATSRDRMPDQVAGEFPARPAARDPEPAGVWQPDQAADPRPGASTAGEAPSRNPARIHLSAHPRKDSSDHQAAPPLVLAPDTPTPAADPLVSPAPADAPGQPLHTSEGGLFYLINFLARPEAQALLRAHEALAGPDANGWVWLWGLGRQLGLDTAGPLAGFLAEQSGRDLTAEDGRGPALTALAALGARLYGAGDGPDDLWRPDLLRVPARLRASPSHLDIDYPMTAVRLAVRRVALDVNPGWVPWLGRVVTLHYLDPWPGAGPSAPSAP